MLKIKLSIDQNDLIDNLLQSVLTKGESTNLPPEILKDIEDQFRLKITPILSRGISIVENGSQMKIDTIVNGDGYQITVNGYFGQKPKSLISRIFLR